jgi:glycosyltransferase involved in cell wall biosynthesis
MLNDKITYIADFSLPNKSAYSLHVIKMCDGFSELKKNVELIIPHLNKKYSSKRIRKDYLLKHKFKIKGFFLTKNENNFFNKLYFTFKIKKYLKNKSKSLIISRSIIPSLILAIFNIKNIIEIHTELTGITKFFFLIIKINYINKNLKFIFINDYLRRKFNVKKDRSIILFDAVDYKDFKPIKTNLIKKTCFYSGSFVRGKGVEIILKIAKKIPDINFHLYGNINTIYDKSILNTKPKNIEFKGYLTYSNLVKKINNYKVLLMPYKKNVGVLISNIDVSRYFSPLKMFDYLAAGKIIIASDLNVYRNILKNNENSIIVKENVNLWCKNIKKVFKTNSFNNMGKNARKSSKKFSWVNRANEVLNFYEK